MTDALAFDHLVQALHPQCAALPDCRKGKHTQDASADAALGACAVFFTPSPSCLAYQRTMRHAKGRSHADSLLEMGESPGDTQIRTRLDPIEPAPLFPVFAGVYAALDRAEPWGSVRAVAGQVRMAFDGTELFASPEMHGDRCSQRTHRNGQVTAVHHVLTPVLVAPGNPAVMALQPECSTPPDGHAQPDWAQVAAQRWIARHAGRSPHVTSVGDDRSCQQPVCELWRHHDDHGLVVCTPEAHTTLYAWLAGVEAAGDLQRCTVRRWNGRFRTLDTSRDATAVPLRGCPLAWLSPCVAVPLRGCPLACGRRRVVGHWVCTHPHPSN